MHYTQKSVLAKEYKKIVLGACDPTYLRPEHTCHAYGHITFRELGVHYMKYSFSEDFGYHGIPFRSRNENLWIHAYLSDSTVV
jgi:hypothetical protein